MKLQEKINEDIKIAMKNSDSGRLAVLRQLKNAFTNAAIIKGNVNNPLDDVEALGIVRKQVAQREDSFDAYDKANRADLAIREYNEMAILKEYLPAALTNDQVSDMVDSAIAELGATSKRDMGKVIKRVVELANGATDNKTISTLVGQKLQ
jgi:uncharacterized protein YqeY